MAAELGAHDFEQALSNEHDEEHFLLLSLKGGGFDDSFAPRSSPYVSWNIRSLTMLWGYEGEPAFSQTRSGVSSLQH